MKVLVLDRNSRDNDNPIWVRLRERRHDVAVCELKDCPFEPDAILNMSITLMDLTFAAVSLYPQAKLFCYNWDTYEWVWTNPRKAEYDYKRYGDLLRFAEEVWTPSHCTTKRTHQFYGEKIKVHRILAVTEWWDVVPGKGIIKDRGYVLCCLREIPDKHWGMLSRCCQQLSIPMIMTNHRLSIDVYRRAVNECRFICAPLHELSTGGISLTEAHYHGKPVLLSDSEWNGGRDYMGNRATYFRDGDEEDLKTKLTNMYYMPERWSLEESRSWVKTMFSPERFGDDVADRLEVYQ